MEFREVQGGLQECIHSYVRKIACSSFTGVEVSSPGSLLNHMVRCLLLKFIYTL